MPTILELPDLRQRNGFTCGPVCAAVVLQYFGRPVPRQFPSCSPIDGTDPLALVPVFRRAGLHVQAGEMVVADLAHHTRLGRPVVCLVQSANMGHYVVVRGIARRRLSYHCPSNGPLIQGVSEFDARWFDQGRDTLYVRFGIAVGAN